MSYRFSIENDIAYTELIGPTTLDDLIAVKTELQSTESFQYRKCSIWDFSRCDPSQMKPEQIETALAYDIGAQHTLPNLKVALIVPNKQFRQICEQYVAKGAEYGLAWNFRIFNTLEEAKPWCGMD